MADVTGVDEFEDLLIEIGKDFGFREATRNVLTPSAKVAMEPVADTARSLARVKTGRMRDSLRVDSRIPTAKDRQSAYVEPDDAVIGIVSVKQSAVSLSEEFGTADKAGHPFLRPALESMQGNVLRRLQSSLTFRLEKYRARKAKGK